MLPTERQIIIPEKLRGAIGLDRESCCVKTLPDGTVICNEPTTGLLDKNQGVFVYRRPRETGCRGSMSEWNDSSSGCPLRDTTPTNTKGIRLSALETKGFILD